MKVTMHKANDGTLFEKQKEMDAHNVKLRLKPAAEAFINDASGYFDLDDRGNPVVYKDDMPDFIVNNADALRKLLNEALIVRRPRKAKAKPQAEAQVQPAA